jgi:hypothetical protein
MQTHLLPMIVGVLLGASDPARTAAHVPGLHRLMTDDGALANVLPMSMLESPFLVNAREELRRRAATTFVASIRKRPVAGLLARYQKSPVRPSVSVSRKPRSARVTFAVSFRS